MRSILIRDEKYGVIANFVARVHVGVRELLKNILTPSGLDRFFLKYYGFPWIYRHFYFDGC